MDIIVLLQQAVLNHASDIFVVAGLPVSYRANGRICREKDVSCGLEAFFWNTQKDCWGIRTLMCYCTPSVMHCWELRICVTSVITFRIQRENLRISTAKSF